MPGKQTPYAFDGLTGERGLVAAVIGQACKDVYGPDQADAALALHWLHYSQEYRHYCELLGREPAPPTLPADGPPAPR